MTDKQLIRFCKSFRTGMIGPRGNPHRTCFMITAPLTTMLEMHGVPNELVEGRVGEGNHFWLRLADGRVLDPTADQFDFGLPAIYLGPPDERIHNPVSK